MAKRLFMTSADYLAIAVSPALIMLLVGSLVFFLVEVLYVGEYQARLIYVFGLFVFATVLVARISIEMGSERAAMYSIPLALATFVVLQRFVEHPSIFSPLINIILIAVVWWCAHRLTWDCTVIDDDQDASGEGLMQLVGVDESETPQQTNQLLSDEKLPSFWQRMFSMESGPHAPGLWVLYFSLAALPIFGIGQGFIPSSDAAGRRWAFMLLFVYVASGLLLLVTTSFLGFRRYLRQRGVDMPNPMAATWVGVGGVLTLIVLFIAMLLPRPAAEFAVAQPPWQASSPDGLSPSRFGWGNDGAQGEEQSSQAVTKNDENAPTGSETREDAENRPAGEPSKDGTKTSDSGEQGEQGDQGQSSDSGESSSDSSDQGTSSDDQSQGENGEQSADGSENSPGERGSEGQPSERGNESQNTDREREGGNQRSDSQTGESAEQQNMQTPEHSSGSKTNVIQAMQNLVGGIAGLIKWLFYIALALVFGYLLWKYRHELITAARELWRDLKALLARLLGREVAETPETDEAAAAPLQPRKRFRDFQNPFATGAYQKVPAAELVRYTFEAFEAWAADRGRSRTADQTPLEFVEAIASDMTDMDQPMRELCHLYGRVAYGGAKVSNKDVAVLRQMWDHMDTASGAVLAR
ncbi:DUF4129 domain-containing protein [Aeoliella sp.]|uniref:DUF4129 domain-containing protein n=1 Tax=Aeoliella sp. TaxID=2795800 RepID=UPI003CCB85AB